MKRSIVYFDALNLFHGMREAKMGNRVWLDVAGLARKLATGQSRLVSVKYYVARFLPSLDPIRNQWQDRHLQALEACGEIEIIEGTFLVRKLECRSCGESWNKPEEKMTDVNLSIDLICDAEDDRFDTAIVVSADGDLTGPVRRVLERHPEKKVIIAVPPSRWSQSLVEAATSHFKIGKSKIRASQLPERIVTKQGLEIERPDALT